MVAEFTLQKRHISGGGRGVLDKDDVHLHCDVDVVASSIKEIREYPSGVLVEDTHSQRV